VALLAVFSTRVAAQESAIRGRVIDARTKRPVASTVELRASDTTIVREGSAEFVIAKLPAGRFELVVRAIGYQSLTMRVALEANDTLVADVDLVRISPKSITRFGPRRSPVSIQSDQPFRLMSITGSRARTRG
jgi:hypothetical protein